MIDRKKKDELTEEERILREARHNQKIVATERIRLQHFRIRNNAAHTIQKAWKMFKFKTQGIMKNARDAIKLKRLDAGELEWKKQIAACTIQLAWRKYARRMLLKQLTKNSNTVMHMWDPNVISARQRTLVELIYSEQLYAPHWHPRPTAPHRPYWTKYLPSSAALSFNFALEQYSQQREIFWGLENSNFNEVEDLDMELDKDLARLQVNDGTIQSKHSVTHSPQHYSYNMRK